jgi:hypothetical protein
MNRKVKVELFETDPTRTRGPERRYRDWLASTAFIGEWSGRRLPGAIPPDRKKTVREQPKLGAVKEHIDRMLEEKEFSQIE